MANTSDRTRALMGFFLGLIVFTAAVMIFHTNWFDFGNMRLGTRLILSGVNPWAPETRIPDFYNPPFAVLFLWPLIFITPKMIVAFGAALLVALAFYHRTWTALAFFATNSFLYLISAGGIDMYVMGGGLLLLTAGDKLYERKLGLALRVLAYGLLLVKPQGTIFIVALYLLMRWDWKGGLLALAIYGLPFIGLFPDWARVLLTDPPVSQTVAAQTVMGKYGPWMAAIVAVLVMASRRWRYWQLGGALAGALSPYGMPGMPIFLILSAIPNLSAIPAIILFSGCMAAITWVAPPQPVDNIYIYINPLLSIYHISMLGMALLLACYSRAEAPDSEVFHLPEPLQSQWLRVRARLRPAKQT